MSLSPRQFGGYEFRIARRDDADQVLVQHEGEVVGSMSYAMPSKARLGEGKEIGAVWVHPEHRGKERRVEGKAKGRGGLGAAMYNVASRDVGYPISHSATLSPRGLRFAQNVGGPMKADRAITRDWEVDDLDTVTEVNRVRWETGEQVDPLIANALTPVQAKRNRRKKPVQEQFPGMEAY